MRKRNGSKKRAPRARRTVKNRKRAASRSARGAEVRRRRTNELSSGSKSSSLDPRHRGRLTTRPRSVPGKSSRGHQAGDDQGIARRERYDSESVQELLDEGQSFEGSAIEGMEEARDADRGPVRTHEPREDDLPEEYENPDR